MSVKGIAKVIIVLTTVSAAVMELVDTSIVNVAITNMAGSLGVSIEDISWVITSYAIANVIIIPLTGFLGDYFGRKNYYVASMILFTVASYMCGQSSGLIEIIIWRFVQGIGGGALLSTSQSILFDAFEPKDRPFAAGLFGMGIVMGPTLGPTIGGYIIEHYSWPLMFMINIPLGIIATILSITFIEKKPGEGKNKKNIHIDYTGILLLMVGVGSLQYVLERGEAEDWFSSHTIQVLGLVAVVGLAAFIIYELSIKNPAVNLKILGNRNLAFTTIFTFVAGCGMYISLFVYPILTQRVLGWTAYETGLSLLLPTFMGVLLLPMIGKAMSKGAPAIPFVITGFILFSLYSYLTAKVSPDVSRGDFFIPLAIRAVGISMVQLPLINQAVVGLQQKDYAAGISLNNMIRQLGGAFGIALANNFIAHSYAQHRTDLISNLTPGSMELTNRIEVMTQGIMMRTGVDSATASNKAMAVLSNSVDRQSYYLSYLDTFNMIAIFFIAVIPLVRFLRAKKKSKEEQAQVMAAVSESH